MKFEIRVTSDEGEVYTGEGPTVLDAARAFCAAMISAPEPFSDEAMESWDEFHRNAAKVAKALGL